MDAGTDVNAAGGLFGYTPLQQATFGGHKEVAELLIAAGADVDAMGGDRWTALLLAAGDGHKEIAELLIAKGADVNAKGWSESTPLLAAVENGHKEIADLLRKHGGKNQREMKAEAK